MQVKMCVNCNAELKTRKQTKYCSNKCQAEFSYKSYIERWLQGKESGQKYEGEVSSHIRRWLFEKNDSKCQKCGWGEVNPVSNKVPLTVNHIDGDWNNHTPDNLELICPNHHSLTPSYGNLNRGNGRTLRAKKKRERQ